MSPSTSTFRHSAWECLRGLQLPVVYEESEKNAPVVASEGRTLSRQQPIQAAIQAPQNSKTDEGRKQTYVDRRDPPMVDSSVLQARLADCRLNWLSKRLIRAVDGI
jgi:hypothetical protein